MQYQLLVQTIMAIALVSWVDWLSSAFSAQKFGGVDDGASLWVEAIIQMVAVVKIKS